MYILDKLEDLFILVLNLSKFKFSNSNLIDRHKRHLAGSKRSSLGPPIWILSPHNFLFW